MTVLSLACFTIVLAGLRKALAFAGWTAPIQKRTFSFALGGILLWLALLGGLSLNGVFRNFTALSPKLLLVPLTGFFIVLLISFSKGFGRLLRSTPPQWLVYFQAFRIFVELLLWFAFFKGLIPSQMTFEGFNYDVFSGILALPAGWMLANGVRYARQVAIAYNLLGLLLLFNIVTIAVLSMPTPFRQFLNDPANRIVAEFPFVYLPGVLVVLAFAFHIFSLRQLLQKNR